eukprot:CAMPEP_0194043960 /NCGR_PEP_ID=MMETSP0009_2-20130614/15522_1 /TAXON_ID=210454 /ORGANISM="Grammatophora oceanica, Strain CCMP 410" /LENGTH=361 /DNA_ID=CAMNT_0038688361 /DNA_START=42 /DNA_END=1127 /DNA_ORIENTATION=-
MMETLSNMLEEASNIATFDMEPLSMESRSAAADLHMLHKSKMHHGPLGASLDPTPSSSTKPTASWKKDSDKPKRPLSAYNLFFQHEREKIITSNPDATFEETMHKIRNTPRPKKRRHRKSHGKIGFAELARTIAEKWKGLGSEERNIFESKAAEEKAAYKEELDQWTKDREERAKLEEQKSPLERARVEVVYDDYTNESKFQNNMYKQAAQSRMQHPQESLSSLMMQNNAAPGPGRGSVPTVGDVRDYLQMTQQTIEMARATLSLPLFANIGGQGGHGMMGQSMMGGMSALEQSQNVGMSAQDLLGMASNANVGGNMGYGGSSLAGAYGGSNHGELSNQDVYNQLMSGTGSNPLVDLHNHF